MSVLLEEQMSGQHLTVEMGSALELCYLELACRADVKPRPQEQPTSYAALTLQRLQCGIAFRFRQQSGCVKSPGQEGISQVRRMSIEIRFRTQSKCACTR